MLVNTSTVKTLLKSSMLLECREGRDSSECTTNVRLTLKPWHHHYVIDELVEVLYEYSLLVSHCYCFTSFLLRLCKLVSKIRRPSNYLRLLRPNPPTSLRSLSCACVAVVTTVDAVVTDSELVGDETEEHASKRKTFSSVTTSACVHCFHLLGHCSRYSLCCQCHR